MSADRGPPPSLRFLGATGTVTGSRTLIWQRGSRVLIDCGLFQGLKQLRLRNRQPFPFEAARLRAVVLTHAHLDHSGALPLLVRDGFEGPIFCTPATRELTAILLRDSAHLQEEEAGYANRKGYSKHRPALPLYDREDAERAIERLEPIVCGHPIDLGPMSATLHPAGHILGAAFVEMRLGDATILFSGNVGRPHDPVIPASAPPPAADFALLESTYGDRVHSPTEPAEELATIVRATAARGGTVLIPAFAVGRAQLLLYLLWRLRVDDRIPELPVHLDSPMAAEVTDLLERFPGDHRLGPAEMKGVRASTRIVRGVEESKAIDRAPGPAVIIAGSGMVTGGRVLHHLKVFGPDHRSTLLLSGFQAAGTRGADLLHGARTVKVHGDPVHVRADVRLLDGLSAHADREELVDWISSLPRAPHGLFLNHGEPVAADALRKRIADRLGWSAAVPDYRERVRLG